MFTLSLSIFFKTLKASPKINSFLIPSKLKCFCLQLFDELLQQSQLVASSLLRELRYFILASLTFRTKVGKNTKILIKTD